MTQARCSAEEGGSLSWEHGTRHEAPGHEGCLAHWHSSDVVPGTQKMSRKYLSEE